MTAWRRAKWRGAVCRTCDQTVWPGQEVGRWGGQWQHRACVEAQASVVRILSGGQEPDDRPRRTMPWGRR